MVKYISEIQNTRNIGNNYFINSYQQIPLYVLIIVHLKYSSSKKYDLWLLEL